MAKLIADINESQLGNGDEPVHLWSRNSYFTNETRVHSLQLNPTWRDHLENELKYNYIINDLHAVGDTLYAVGQYKVRKGLCSLPSIGMMARCSGRKR